MTTILIAAAGGFLVGIGCVGLVFWLIAKSVGRADARRGRPRRLSDWRLSSTINRRERHGHSADFRNADS